MKMVRPYIVKYMLAILCILVYIILALIAPLFTKLLVDEVIEGGNTALLKTILLALGGIAIISAISVYSRRILVNSVSQNIIYDLRVGIYEHLNEMPYSFYDKNSVGDMMSRMTSDINSVRELFSVGTIMIIEQVVFFFGAITFLFYQSWQIGLVALSVVPFMAFLGLRFEGKIHPAFKSIREQNAVLNARTQENVMGVRVVKAYAREDYEMDRFHDDNEEHMKRGFKIYSIFADYIPKMEFASSLLPAFILLVSSLLLINNTITMGTILAIFGYLWLVQKPMRELGNILNMISQAIASAERLYSLMDLDSDIKEKKNAQFPDEFKGHVEMNNVTFSYGDENVLSNINIEVKPGATLAIMGTTGSGKTSIVNLLGRFYECSQGSVKIDGIDVKDYELKKLRSKIAYIMQDTFLYSDTLGANIAFGQPQASIEEIEQAAKIAQAEEFVSQIPMGYDLKLGERGMGLSGGQKQRISIARALLMKPAILVLDDATSAVDMETEHEIQMGLKEFMKDCTTFIISHRISSVRDADEIIIMEKGRIVERGKHQELLEKKGLYYSIFMDQYKDYQDIMHKEVL